MILLLTLAACTTSPPVDDGPDPFADEVVTFTPGPGAGFGQDALPDVVLGPPRGAGPNAGSLDVVSLGTGGEIVVAFDEPIVDGDGPDLIVFENAFPGWVELGEVAVSLDGSTFTAWPCGPDGTGCAGVTPTLSHPDNGVDPTDPTVAGGDAFDLADLDLDEVFYVRVRDTGDNAADSPTAGFDLDAVAAVHGP